MIPLARAAARKQDAAALLQRAFALRTLAEAFAYPDAGHVRRVRAMFARLARPGAADPPLHRAIVRAERAWANADDEPLRAEYARLFLGNAPCPLRETAYGDARRVAGRSAELADIAGFYTAFGFAVSEREPDLPDHLCAELEFCSVLLLKLAYGARGGWSAGGRIVAHALRSFVQDHLGRWVRALGAELERAGARAPYRELARLLERIVANEAKRLSAAPSPFAGRLPEDFMQADEYRCPMASGLAA
jgi:TorA maturation chaperone TorD